jgi:indole-3-glycerol phosphate synthase
VGNAPDILKEIVEEKWREIEARKSEISEASLKNAAVPETRDFYGALKSRIDHQQTAVIAEIKKASPSKGIIRKDFDPVSIAQSYEAAGASCLSILTDRRFFMGADSFLIDARQAVALPVLRKDFIVDAYQVFEARKLGADCILLIVSILDIEKLRELHELAVSLEMDVLVEVHDGEEMELALALSPRLLGINNRNLRTFEVDLKTSLSLLDKVPGKALVITESGIHTRQDVQLMVENNIYGFLVGESFMRESDPGEKLKALFS